MRSILVLVLASVLVALLAGPAGQGVAFAQPWAPWKDMAPAPAGAEEVYGAVAGGKVYVMGGIDIEWRPFGLVLEYDPASDRWAQKKTMPELKHHVGVASLGGKVYLMGGFVWPEKGPPAWTPVASAWEYTPATDSWRKLAPLPSPRGALACAALEGKVYCAGGARLPAWSQRNGIGPGSEIEQPNDLLVYDPSANAWTPKAPMPTPRNHFTLTAAGGKLYAIGGRIGHAFVSGWSVPAAANEEYDPATDRWRLRSPLPSRRSAHAAVEVNGKVHVLGGEEWQGFMSGVHRTHEVYDPQTNRWAVSAPMRTPRHGFVAGTVGNRIFAISGANVSGASGPHVELKSNEALEVK